MSSQGYTLALASSSESDSDSEGEYNNDQPSLQLQLPSSKFSGAKSPRSPRSAAERRKSFDQWIMDKDQQKEMEKQLKKQLAKQQTQGQNGGASANMQRRMSHVEWLEVKAVEDKIKKSESDEAKEREKQERSFRDKIKAISTSVAKKNFFSRKQEEVEKKEEVIMNRNRRASIDHNTLTKSKHDALLAKINAKKEKTRAKRKVSDKENEVGGE